MNEFELFMPIQKLFTENGYKVNAEVRDCDITAVRNDELVIIEMKKNLSVILLAQGLERQKTGADVYIAIPKPKKYSPKKFRDTLYVLKKLELGLIFVNLKGEHSFAEIVLTPQEFKPVGKRYSERKKIIKEINGRSIDNNIGGVTGQKIATAFTEKCIHIACVLEKYGPLSPAGVRRFGTDEQTSGILYRNTYGWFDRPEKGIYDINDKFKTEISNYPQLYEYYSCAVSSNSPTITNTK